VAPDGKFDQRRSVFALRIKEWKIMSVNNDKGIDHPSDASGSKSEKGSATYINNSEKKTTSGNEGNPSPAWGGDQNPPSKGKAPDNNQDGGKMPGGAPNTDQSAPTPGKSAPDAGKPAPDGGNSVPDSGKPAPDSGKPAPDSGKPAPDAGDAGKSAPDDSSKNPDPPAPSPSKFPAKQPPAPPVPGPADVPQGNSPDLPEANEGKAVPKKGSTPAENNLKPVTEMKNPPANMPKDENLFVASDGKVYEQQDDGSWKRKGKVDTNTNTYDPNNNNNTDAPTGPSPDLPEKDGNGNAVPKKGSQPSENNVKLVAEMNPPPTGLPADVNGLYVGSDGKCYKLHKDGTWWREGKIDPVTNKYDKNDNS
jgi:hypothetical protein